MTIFGGGIGCTHEFIGISIMIFGFIMIAYGVKNRN